MAFIRKHWKKVFAGLFLLAFPAAWFAIQWAGNEIASPPRRALMDYHQAFLTKPTEHGLRIETFTASDGTPCLVCLPAHGSADRVVPLAAGRRLFDSLPSSTTKKWLEIPGADHDNVLITPFPIYAEITEWMIREVW